MRRGASRRAGGGACGQQLGSQSTACWGPQRVRGPRDVIAFTASHRRDCHSAAPLSTFIRCFNRDRERASAKCQCMATHSQQPSSFASIMPTRPHPPRRQPTMKLRKCEPRTPQPPQTAAAAAAPPLLRDRYRDRYRSGSVGSPARSWANPSNRGFKAANYHTSHRPFSWPPAWCTVPRLV